MKKSCIITLPLLALCTSHAVKPEISAENNRICVYQELNQGESDICQSLVNWLKSAYSAELKKDRDGFKILLNKVVNQDFVRIFAKDRDVIIAELYKEVVGEEYSKCLANQGAAHREERTLSQIIEQHLASLSPEELKYIDIAIQNCVESAGEILGELTSHAKEEAPVEVVEQKHEKLFGWSLNERGRPIYTDAAGNEKLLDGKLASLAASPDGTKVWGINGESKIFYRMGIDQENILGTNWQVVPGLLAQVVITSQNNVWGVNGQGSVFFTNKNTDANPSGIGWPNVACEPVASILVDGNDDVVVITLEGNKLKRLGITLDNPLGESWEVIS